MKTTHTIHRTPAGLRPSAWAMILALATLGLAATVRAAVPVAGAYNGTYQGGGQTGNLAMFVDGTGWAGLLKLGQTWAGGGFMEGIRVDTHGWFRGFTASGAVLTGTISGTNLYGAYGGGSAAGTLTALGRPNTGPQEAAAGYYGGPATGNYHSGTVRAILAADGAF